MGTSLTHLLGDDVGKPVCASPSGAQINMRPTGRCEVTEKKVEMNEINFFSPTPSALAALLIASAQPGGSG